MLTGAVSVVLVTAVSAALRRHVADTQLPHVRSAQ
jgi:hypothetical protein